MQVCGCQPCLEALGVARGRVVAGAAVRAVALGPGCSGAGSDKTKARFQVESTVMECPFHTIKVLKTGWCFQKLGSSLRRAACTASPAPGALLVLALVDLRVSVAQLDCDVALELVLEAHCLHP